MQKYLHKGFQLFNILPSSHPMLHTKIYDLYNFTDQEQDILEIMIDTLKFSKDSIQREALGLSAPQVGWQKRVFITADLSRITKKNILNKIDVIINPQIIAQSTNFKVDVESCLSFQKDEEIPITRPDWIIIKYYNLLGKEITVKTYDYQARLYLHEFDHLEGKTIR